MTDEMTAAILTRLDVISGEIRQMVSTMERHVAADEAWTALGARLMALLTESTAGRALVAVVVVRVLFGSTADALLLAGVQRLFGLDSVTP